VGIGAITIPAAGAPTLPDPFPLPDTPSINVPGVLRYSLEQPFRFTSAPGPRMVLAFNGTAPVLNLVGTLIIRTGLLAPYAALTVTTTGTKASRALTTTGNFTNGDRFDLVSAGDQTNNSWPVVIVSAFSATGANQRYYQVLLGASASATLDNIVGMVNGTGIDGSTFRSPTIDEGRETTDHPRAWSDWITATKTSAAIVTFTAVAPGTPGNTYECTEVTDGGGTWSFPSALFTGGAAGTGTAPNMPGSGLFIYGYGYYRSIDGAFSGLSPTTEYQQLDPGETDLSVIADPPASHSENIDTKIWYRSTGEGSADVLYEGYRIAVADTTDDDDLEDSEDGGIAEHALYDPQAHRTFADGFVPRRTSCATLRERIFSAGHVQVADYAFGEAAFTNGSNVVTLVALGSATPVVTKRMEGRILYNNESALNAATLYRIIYTVEASNQVVLDRAYEGNTDANAQYVISDRADAYETIYSEVKEPNNWPNRNTLRGPTSSAPAGITAMLYAFESILEWTQTGLWRITGSDPFRVSSEYEGAGCVGSNAVDEAEGWVYWQARDGLYRWSGQGLPECISARPTRKGDLVGVRETVRRVNQTWARYSVVKYCPATRVVRFFIPLDDEVTNRYALVYDVQSGVWSLDHYGFDVTAAHTVSDRTGALRTVVGTVHGDLIELDVGTSDCGYGAEPVGTITASTTRTVTCGAASFLTSGNAWKGAPVVFVDASGNFTYNTIAENTGTVLTFTRPMATAPTGKVIVGGIHAILESGRFHAGDPAHIKGLPFIRLIYSVGDDGQVYVSVAGDQDDAAVVDAAGVDLTGADGEAEIMPLVEGRFLKIRLDVVEPGTEVRLLTMRLETAGAVPGAV